GRKAPDPGTEGAVLRGYALHRTGAASTRADGTRSAPEYAESMAAGRPQAGPTKGERVMTSHHDTQRRQQALLTTALGALGALLHEPDVVEVLINPDGQVWCERQGTPLVPTGDVFSSAQVEALICTVAGVNGLACTAAHPSVSAVLPGSGAR